MSGKILSEWLEKIRLQHRLEIDLTLDRVKFVAKKLGIDSLNCPIITVGGTNGKGSTVAGLEKIWQMAGFNVGAFTSPWLYRFNEIVRVNCIPVSDDLFISAFEKIDAIRGEVTLTQFEFNTLAALLIFQASNLDVVILEVGLGGRLDAVNILAADVAVVTSIDLDHMDRLGDTREKIGFEKAGIFRKNQIAICGDLNPPSSLTNYAKNIGAKFFLQGRDFGFIDSDLFWSFWYEDLLLANLPKPKLLLSNMSIVLMVVNLLQNKLPVNLSIIKQVLSELVLSGRIEIRAGDIVTIIDVAHNPAAASVLSSYLKTHPIKGQTRAVFSMLADKDILTTVIIMSEVIDEWFVAPLNVPRAASMGLLKEIFNNSNIIDEKTIFTTNIKEAYSSSQKKSNLGDRIVIFGSFYTVSAALAET